MPTKDQLMDWLEERSARFIPMADAIWREPQVALEETFACKLQIDDLSADGFQITANIGGLPTAFVAEWGSGAPIIGFLGEYDALPNLSQHNRPTENPIVPGGPGHGCGHNLLGTACLAAASALKAWLTATGQPGTVRYYGCPAEETLRARSSWPAPASSTTWTPPSPGTPAAPPRSSAAARWRWTTSSSASTARPPTRPSSPEAGRSALDAVELMNVGVNFLREHVPTTVRMHYVITNGGGAPNVVPDEAEVWYFVRAPERHRGRGRRRRACGASRRAPR